MAGALSRAKASSLLWLLAVGNFIVGMGVFVVIGIVSPIAEALSVSKADAGMVVTSYAVAYALLSPVGAALTGRFRRRTVLAAAIGLFCFGTLLSAVSNTLILLALSRLVVALGAALYTPLSAGVAVAVAPPNERGRALAKVFAGMSMAQVLGVPAGAWVAYRFGWHAPFFLVAGLAALFAVALLRMVPRDIHVPAGNVRSILTAFGNLRLMLALAFTLLLMTSVYILFTFFGPIIEASTGAEEQLVPLYFALFGIGAVGGNFIGGYLSDRLGAVRTLAMVCLGHMVLLPLFAVSPWNPWLLALIVTVWSGFAWCFMPPQQTRLVTIAPDAPALALALNAAMVYGGIAIGSSIGAGLLAWQGLGMLGVAAGLSAGLTLLVLLVSDRLGRRPSTSASP